MKTTPTDVDREAGQAFVPWPAMRVMWTTKSKRWERIADGTAHTGHPFAIDADDHATAGQMLAQVEAAAGTDCVVTHGTMVEPAGELKWKVRKANGFDLHVLGNVFGPTRGAALVAAKRALAAPETA